LIFDVELMDVKVRYEVKSWIFNLYYKKPHYQNDNWGFYILFNCAKSQFRELNFFEVSIFENWSYGCVLVK
jgi:hypothetical protein